MKLNKKTFVIEPANTDWYPLIFLAGTWLLLAVLVLVW